MYLLPIVNNYHYFFKVSLQQPAQMKLLIVLVSLTLCASLYAQTMIGDSIYISKDTLRFEAGQYIDVGRGTMTKDSFRYIYLTPMNAAYLIYGETRRIYLDSASAGKKLLIKKVKQLSGKKSPVIYLLVVETEKRVAYYCNIEPALSAGEIKKKGSY